MCVCVEKRASSCQPGPPVQLNTDWADTCQQHWTNIFRTYTHYTGCFLNVPPKRSAFHVSVSVCVLRKGHINISMMHRGWCTRDDAPGMMHRGWCTGDDALGMMHRGWDGFLAFDWLFQLFLSGDQPVLGNWENCKMQLGLGNVLANKWFQEMGFWVMMMMMLMVLMIMMIMIMDNGLLIYLPRFFIASKKIKVNKRLNALKVGWIMFDATTWGTSWKGVINNSDKGGHYNYRTMTMIIRAE